MSEVMALTEKLYKDLEAERARVRELERERDSLRQRLRQAVEHVYGSGSSDGLSTDEELFAAIENLVEVISAKDKRVKELEEFLRALLACSVCGKFDFDLTPEAVKAIKALLAQAGWGHSSCVKQRKP